MQSEHIATALELHSCLVTVFYYRMNIFSEHLSSTEHTDTGTDKYDTFRTWLSDFVELNTDGPVSRGNNVENLFIHERLYYIIINLVSSLSLCTDIQFFSNE